MDCPDKDECKQLKLIEGDFSYRHLNINNVVLNEDNIEDVINICKQRGIINE